MESKEGILALNDTTIGVSSFYSNQASALTLFWQRGYETVISILAVDRRGCSASDPLQNPKA